MVFGFETALARAAVLRDNLNHMTPSTEPTTAVDTRPDQRRGTLSGAAAVLLWATLAALTALSGDIPPFQLLAMSFALAFLVGVGLWAWEDRRATTPARRARVSSRPLTNEDRNDETDPDACGNRRDLPEHLQLDCHKKLDKEKKSGASGSYGRLHWDQPAPTMITVARALQYSLP